MVTRKLKIMAFVIVVALVVACGVYLMFWQHTDAKPSEAERMTLTIQDLEMTGWLDNHSPQAPPNYSNLSSSYFREMSNGTLIVQVSIDVFNTSGDCLAAYHSLWPELHSYGLLMNLTLGDKSVYWLQGENTPSVIFTRSNVMAWVESTTYSGVPSWQSNAIIALAMLQLQKVNANLPSNVGKGLGPSLMASNR